MTDSQTQAEAEESICATSTSLRQLNEDEYTTTTWSPIGAAPVTKFSFLPDFTEHPKPKKKKHRHDTGDGDSGKKDDAPQQSPDEEESDEIAFFYDFVAGGVAGCASVVVGHPFDTMKVRMQTSTATSGILQTIREFGGVASLFRGMGAPLGAAAAVNATVFSGYGFASRLFDQYITEPRQQAEDDYDDNDEAPTHDPWQKSLVCGSFAGAAQCVIVCPMEHIKCRLQTQNDKALADSKYKGPIQATRKIISKYGFQRLYQGWWSTFVREVPAFGLYFASYDYMKDRANSYLLERDRRNLQLAGQAPDAAPVLSNTHTWLASAVSGGFAGSWTWAIVYPVDLIKSKIQTAPLDTPLRQLGMWNVGKSIVEKHGARALWRGLGITLIRAFPVNGTIFPVYEFTLKHISSLDVTS